MHKYLMIRKSGFMKKMKRKPWNVYEGDCLISLVDFKIISGDNKIARAMGWTDTPWKRHNWEAFNEK